MQPTVLEVSIMKDRYGTDDAYGIMVEGTSLEDPVYFTGRVFKRLVCGPKGYQDMWGWISADGKTCMGFPRRKYAVKHLVMSYHTALSEDVPSGIFYGPDSRPELPEA